MRKDTKIFLIACLVSTLMVAGSIYLKWCHPRSDEQRVLRLQKRVGNLEREVQQLMKQVMSCQKARQGN